jgi:hypothetical protein
MSLRDIPVVHGRLDLTRLERAVFSTKTERDLA